MKCSGAMPPQCPIRRVGRDFEPLLWVIAGIALCLAVLAVNRTLAVEGKVSAIIVDSLETAAYHASSALEHEARGTDPYHRAYLAENTRMLTNC